MIKKIISFCESVPATIISGVFLLFDLIPHVAENFGKELPFFEFLPFHPSWVTVIISGIPLIYSAIRKLIYNKGISKISSALLITVAMCAAIAIGDLFAAGEVAFIMAIGGILEEKTTERAKKGIKKLISLAPEKGRVIENGTERIVPAEEIKMGDIIRILPGEIIPVDGEIIAGESSIDQSVMTGESLPVDKTIGDSVFCGTINRFGAIDIKATKVGENSALKKLIRMVEEAEDKKAPMQRIADKWASILVPVSLIIAVFAGLLKQDLIVAVTVLVVFCPCALVLATPTAIMAAIGQATKHGVIIKSGEALEKMGKVNAVAFDKTGTLTYGRLEVAEVVSCDEDLSPDDLLRVVASAESKSEHPLGKAILNKAQENDTAITEPSVFRMEAGKGVFAVVNGLSVFCGNEKFITENGIEIADTVLEKLDYFRNSGMATVIAAIGQKVIGIIALSDVLRSDSMDMIKRLEDLEAETVLLTGDNKKTAGFFAERLGIKNVHSQLLPEQKVEHIKNMQSEGKTVCMIGDGINDAPALKTADIGIAMGAIGSDIAIEAADIALMSDDISKIPYLKRLSNATVKTIRFSISLSLIINFAAIVLSVLGLLNPTTGALVHNAGSCFVVLIAALLYDRKFD